ncbi:MAG: hypothetical protein Q7T40_09735 [Methylobacter sp.]|nr:hypothetical protein [Methylobacter sp.]
MLTQATIAHIRMHIDSFQNELIYIRKYTPSAKANRVGFAPLNRQPVNCILLSQNVERNQAMPET